MPGFIDVSHMTDEEVRRLGHADDYDEPVVMYTRNPWAYRKPKPVVPKFSYNSDKVWAAAVIAYRINNGYVKAIAPGVQAHKTNRQIMEQLLSDNMEISQEDIEHGQKIRQYFKALTFKIIEGQTLTPFLTNAMMIAEKDNITDNLGLATIASLPATYYKMTARDDVDRKIKWASGGFIGVEGDSTTQTIEIVKKLWSEKWNTWYYTGINDKDQVLFFAYKGTLEIGTSVTIEGKVKSHRDNSTQLNRVKVI